MSEHTPGPWADICGYITIRSGRNIASVNSHNTTEGKANARLIAAAPDLLSALTSGNFTYLGGEYVLCVDPDVAKAAIAKATGEGGA